MSAQEMSTDAAVLMLLADRQREIEALRAMVAERDQQIEAMVAHDRT